MDQFENTLIVFLADNGGCAEELAVRSNMGNKISTIKTRDGRSVQFGNDPEVMPGGEETYQSCGMPWANVQNTPFRLYKHWAHEGGISTPFIIHWPKGISARNELRHQPAQLPDVMATFLEVAGVPYADSNAAGPVKPLEGFSMARTFDDDAQPHAREVLYWEHEGNRAVRRGPWKLVCKFPGEWELYDIEADRTETRHLAGEPPEVVAELSGLYDRWATRCNVMPWQELQELRRSRR